MLLVTTDGRKAALDINLVDPALPEPEYNKISTAADLIARIYHDTEKWKSVQLVFSDLGTPSSEKRHKDKRHKKSKEEPSRPVVVDRPAVQDEDVVPQTTVAKEVDLGDVKELDETEVAEVREQEEVDRSPVQVDTVALEVCIRGSRKSWSSAAFVKRRSPSSMMPGISLSAPLFLKRCARERFASWSVQPKRWARE